MINYMNQGHTLLQNANGDYYSISPYGDSNNINPYIMRDRGTTKRDGFVFSGSTYLDFTPIKELVITSRLGYRYTYSNSYGYVMPNITCSDLYQDYVSVNATSSNTTYWQWENFANYTKTFADKHNVNVMLGMSYSSNTSFGVTGGINGSRSGDKVDLGITKLDPNYAYFAFQTGTATRTVSGGEKRKYVNLSYFGRASYDYAGKYFAQFTLRADAAGVLITTPVFNTFAMSHPAQGNKVTMKDYLKGDTRTHLIGMLGGFIWMSGMVVSFMEAFKRYVSPISTNAS